MTEKEWMEDVKKRLEQEESFLKKISSSVQARGSHIHSKHYLI